MYTYCHWDRELTHQRQYGPEIDVRVTESRRTLMYLGINELRVASALLLAIRCVPMDSDQIQGVEIIDDEILIAIGRYIVRGTRKHSTFCDAYQMMIHKTVWNVSMRLK